MVLIAAAMGTFVHSFIRHIHMYVELMTPLKLALLLLRTLLSVHPERICTNLVLSWAPEIQRTGQLTEKTGVLFQPWKSLAFGG